MKLLVGLGNPGRKYSRTRHNIGFDVVDAFASAAHVKIGKKKFSALYEIGWLSGVDICIVKSQTFMNLSGEAVSQFVNYFKAPASEMIIVHDDLDIPLGRMKFALNGGDGGHNGVKSIADNLKTREFWRLKIGIGRPPAGVDAADFVLDNFLKEEHRQAKEITALAVEALMMYFSEGAGKAMQKYHSLAVA